MPKAFSLGICLMMAGIIVWPSYALAQSAPTFLKKKPPPAPKPKPATPVPAKPAPTLHAKPSTAPVQKPMNPVPPSPRPPIKKALSKTLSPSETKTDTPPTPPAIDHFPEQIFAVATCQANLGNILAGRTPDGEIADRLQGGTGYVYKFSPEVFHRGWRIIGVYVDPFHYTIGQEIDVFVQAAEAELIALAEANPAFPRKKGALKWKYEGPVSLYAYAVPKLMGIPLDIPERSTQVGQLKTGDRQVSGLTLYGNGVSVIRCYNPPD
jgi:hypothetical protein